MNVISLIFLSAFAVTGSLPKSPAAPSLTPRPVVADLGETATVPQQIRRAEPPSPNASADDLEQKGDELRSEKLYVDAIDYFRVALAKGENARLHNKIGMVHLLLMRTDDARKEFSRAIKLDKNYAEAHNNLGVIYY